MSDVVCRNCGAVNKYTTEQKSNNLVAHCSVCTKFIKNLPTAAPALYVGKYKGIPINQIEDLGYLNWAFKTLPLTGHIRQAVADKISSLENLGR